MDNQQKKPIIDENHESHARMTCARRRQVTTGNFHGAACALAFAEIGRSIGTANNIQFVGPISQRRQRRDTYVYTATPTAIQSAGMYNDVKHDVKSRVLVIYLRGIRQIIISESCEEFAHYAEIWTKCAYFGYFVFQRYTYIFVSIDARDQYKRCCRLLQQLVCVCVDMEKSGVIFFST